MKKPLSVILTALAGVFIIIVGLIIALRPDNNTPPQFATNRIAQARALPVVYTNDDYGFSFSLPAGWSGYSVISDKWASNPPSEGGMQYVEQGPLITLRHPRWTQKAPRQDIPIMILTVGQWNDLAKGKFIIGAAPVAPRELGRNERFVFTIPARYNFAFPIGYEQVNEIIAANPLHAF